MATTAKQQAAKAAAKALLSANRVASKQRLVSTVGVNNSTNCNILRLTSVLSAGNGNDEGLRVGFTEGFRFNPKGLSRKSAKVWITKDSLKDVFVSSDYCVTISKDGTQSVDFQQLSAATTTSLASVIEELDLVDSEVKVDFYLYFANIYTKMLDENPFEQVDLDCYDIVEDYDGEVIHKAKFLVNSISGFEEGTTEVAVEETAEVVAAE